jgi:hypothetical protein
MLMVPGPETTSVQDKLCFFSFVPTFTVFTNPIVCSSSMHYSLSAFLPEAATDATLHPYPALTLKKEKN